jgi:uncharacterized membrane protein YfcA
MDLDSASLAGLVALVFAAAILYSSVGHGGASGYLAAMALVGIAPATMKPAALAMNIAVAGLVGVRLYRAGYFDRRLFWPFALGSIPLAFLGGAWRLADPVYRYLVGATLAVAAVRLALPNREATVRGAPPWWIAAPIGAGLGLVAGLTGVGGGIFLSPLVLLARWADMRTTAGLSAAFIFVNSVAALAGHSLSDPHWPAPMLWMMAAALAGAAIGSELAVRRAAPLVLRQLLALVLGVAALKFALT